MQEESKAHIQKARINETYTLKHLVMDLFREAHRKQISRPQKKVSAFLTLDHNKLVLSDEHFQILPISVSICVCLIYIFFCITNFQISKKISIAKADVILKIHPTQLLNRQLFITLPTCGHDQFRIHEGTQTSRTITTLTFSRLSVPPP